MIRTTQVTSEDGVKFTVQFHAKNEAQASIVEGIERAFAKRTTAYLLDLLAPEYMREKFDPNRSPMPEHGFEALWPRSALAFARESTPQKGLDSQSSGEVK